MIAALLWALLSSSALAETTGLGGSISNGNIAGKTNVFVSSFAATSAIGATVVLSSRTTTTGKTFYLQHIDVWGFLPTPSTFTPVNMGSVAIFTPTTVRAASMTFINSAGSNPPWIMEFAEPVPIASGVVLASSVTANTASAVTWITNFVGYEK